jgi:hypothetical protein
MVGLARLHRIRTHRIAQIAAGAAAVAGTATNTATNTAARAARAARAVAGATAAATGTRSEAGDGAIREAHPLPHVILG